MAAETGALHWKGERDADGILWLTLDKQGAGANTLSRDVIDEFDVLLAEIENSPPGALVIRSGKPGGFIAGADVKEFTQLKGHAEAIELIRRCHGVLDRLEALSCPTVSLIHGYCLGGGLELALATDWRIAMDDPRTRLGLPEVRLGIHPGFGGSLRAPRLVGHLNALDLMLSGRSLSAHSARKIGLVDHVVPERHLQRAARAVALDPPKPHRPAWWQRLAGIRPVRPQVARLMKKKLAAKVDERHYPAPYALLDLWVAHAGDRYRMLSEEANSVARLIVGDTAQNLIRVFFLQEKLKSLGKDVDFAPRHVHVVGAGVMGGDIAAWCALQGLNVSLQDQSPERIAPAIRRAHELFSMRLREPRLVRAAMDRLMPDTRGLGVARADVVIEAIFENIDAKQALYRTLEPRMKPGALLATNTSSIPLETLGAALGQPGRLVGLHFFNPVAKMQLVEVVHGHTTAPGCIAQATAFARRIDRLPLPVRSHSGFLVNRVLMPYLMEAVVAMNDGISVEVIDRTAVDFGMPMGPVELADTVGLDICLSVAEQLSEPLGLEVPERLRRTVDAGYFGRKSGRGFYRWRNGKPVRSRQDRKQDAPNDLCDRLILAMLNEAVACLREGIVEDADALDAGIVFGTGFAPFRGGPIQYIRHHGVNPLREKLLALNRSYGARFDPDEGWMHL
jgi:3-hydroxyacyl-CoA dehydrogenase / enoyl-CoA hydratase / 3-hydroxybutyryl-CoA epimerase